MNDPTEKNIILYDEFKVARLKTTELFKEFFINIHSASNETELFYLISEPDFDIDLIIFNDSFDNDRGFQLLSKFKDRNREIPVLILSSNDNKEIFLKAIAEGATDYILMPSSEALILERVLKILNNNRILSKPNSSKLNKKVAFDITDYLRGELKKADKGDFQLSLTMFKFFVPTKSDDEGKLEHYQYVSDLFYKKLAEMLWDTDVTERLDLNTFIGIFPFCGLNNINKVYNKIIDSFDKIKKSNKKLSDFHLVLTSLTYPVKGGSPEELMSSLEKSIELEMKKINGLLLKFK